MHKTKSKSSSRNSEAVSTPAGGGWCDTASEKIGYHPKSSQEISYVEKVKHDGRRTISMVNGSKVDFSKNSSSALGSKSQRDSTSARLAKQVLSKSERKRLQALRVRVLGRDSK